jgi:hypothetical protein
MTIMYRRDRLRPVAPTPSGVRYVNDDLLRLLWPTRLSDKELAARLGHHRSVVRRRAVRLGLKPRREVWSSEAAVSLALMLDDLCKSPTT